MVWVGGTHELVCASPATGRAMARTPTDPAQERLRRPTFSAIGEPSIMSFGHATL